MCYTLKGIIDYLKEYKSYLIADNLHEPFFEFPSSGQECEETSNRSSISFIFVILFENSIATMCWNARFSPSFKMHFHIFSIPKRQLLSQNLKYLTLELQNVFFFDEYFYVTLCQLKTSDTIRSGSHRCFQTAMTQDEEMRDWDCSNTLFVIIMFFQFGFNFLWSYV